MNPYMSGKRLTRGKHMGGYIVLQEINTMVKEYIFVS